MSEDLQSPNFGNVQNSGIAMVSLIILFMDDKKTGATHDGSRSPVMNC